MKHHTRRRLLALIGTATMALSGVSAAAIAAPPPDTSPPTTEPAPTAPPTTSPEPATTAPPTTAPPTTAPPTTASPTTVATEPTPTPPVTSEPPPIDVPPAEPLIDPDTLVESADVALEPLAADAVPAALAVAASTGCVRDAGASTSTCSLWARSGTAAIDSATSLPVWVFDDSPTDPIELVNPVLEAYEGDTIRLDLVNVDIAPAVSVALPAVAGLPDSTGIAPGSSTSYTFDPLPAGTYLYQAGPTPQGNRQVAMGMAGILIVRPAGYVAGDPLGQTAFGDPASAFGDEILALANEFDPRLNADPMGFDMSGYTPSVFTLNGQSHEGGVIPELQAGSRVMLRAANLGLMQRRLGFSGLRHTQLSENSRRLSTPLDDAAVTLPPGVVADAIATMPLDMGINVAVIDLGLSLFKGSSTLPAGQIDIYAIPGMGGSSGPVIGGFTATPEVTDGSSLVLDASITTVATAAPTVRYFLDYLSPGDTGQSVGPVTGSGNAWTLAGGAVTPSELAALANGEHVVWLQAGEDVGGPGEIWGPVVGYSFRIDRDGPVVHSVSIEPAVSNGTIDMTVRATADTTLTGSGTDVQQVKYTIDGPVPLTADMPSIGTPLSIVGDNPTRAAVEGTIDLSGLADGVHTMYLFALDSFPGGGHWSQVPTAVTFLVDQGQPVVSVAAVTPTPNNGTIAHPGSQVFLESVRLEAVITDPPISGQAAGSGIVAAEFTIGVAAEPAGTGEPMGSSTATWGTTDELGNVVQLVYADIPLADIRTMPEGEVHFWVRGLDEAGNWSEAVNAVLVLDLTAPTITVDAAPPAGTVRIDVTDPSSGSPGVDTGVAIVEWFEGPDPGFGNGTPVPLVPAGQSQYLALDITGLAPGTAIWVRAADGVGNWSLLTSAVAGAGP